MIFDRADYPGGREYKMLITTRTRKIIRAAAVIAVLILIYSLLR